MQEKRWHLRTGKIREFVFAKNQWEAWDALRDRPAEDFGLIVEAEPGENDNPIVVRTASLMFRWKRDDDARRFIARAMEVLGIENMEAEDRAVAEASPAPLPKAGG